MVQVAKCATHGLTQPEMSAPWVECSRAGDHMSCMATAAGLADLAQQHGAYVQSHISESWAEADYVRSLHPGAPHDAHVFAEMGLLTSKVRGCCLQRGSVLLMCMSEPHAWQSYSMRTGAASVAGQKVCICFNT